MEEIQHIHRRDEWPAAGTHAPGRRGRVATAWGLEPVGGAAERLDAEGVEEALVLPECDLDLS